MIQKHFGWEVFPIQKRDSITRSPSHRAFVSGLISLETSVSSALSTEQPEDETEENRI